MMFFSANWNISNLDKHTIYEELQTITVENPGETIVTMQKFYLKKNNNNKNTRVRKFCHKHQTMVLVNISVSK